MTTASPRDVSQPTIAILVTLKLDGLVAPHDLANALMRLAWERCGRPDDPGLDWHTDTAGNTYITVDPDWRVSADPAVAALIDAAHVLLGYDLRSHRLTPEDFARAAQGNAS